jgi:hypothetical protein
MADKRRKLERPCRDELVVSQPWEVLDTVQTDWREHAEHGRFLPRITVSHAMPT